MRKTLKHANSRNMSKRFSNGYERPMKSNSQQSKRSKQFSQTILSRDSVMKGTLEVCKSSFITHCRRKQQVLEKVTMRVIWMEILRQSGKEIPTYMLLHKFPMLKIYRK